MCGSDWKRSAALTPARYVGTVITYRNLDVPVKTPKTIELKIVPIGNSRGVRLPKEIIERYAIEDSIVLEAREETLVFRNKRDKRLSWEDTFKAMAREREDWSDFEGTVADGLDPAERW